MMKTDSLLGGLFHSSRLTIGDRDTRPAGVSAVLPGDRSLGAGWESLCLQGLNPADLCGAEGFQLSM